MVGILGIIIHVCKMLGLVRVFGRVRIGRLIFPKGAAGHLNIVIDNTDSINIDFDQI